MKSDLEPASGLARAARRAPWWISLALMSLLYVSTGIAHFTRPEIYLAIMPPYLPFHLESVYLSGAFELGLGLALWIPRLRPHAGIGLVLLLIAVFPANLHMALHPEQFARFPPAALWIRLPLQLVLIAWAYLGTRSGEAHPFGERPTGASA